MNFLYTPQALSVLQERTLKWEAYLNPFSKSYSRKGDTFAHLDLDYIWVLLAINPNSVIEIIKNVYLKVI